jgi:hypothetical protein
MDGEYLKFDLKLLMSVVNSPNRVTVKPAEAMPTMPTKPKRCQMAECKAKLALTDSACKCSGFYCMKHRHAETHSCAFDYKGEGMGKLKTQLVEAKGVKIENI